MLKCDAIQSRKVTASSLGKVYWAETHFKGRKVTLIEY